MPRFRHIFIACLALAVAGDFAWHFYEGDSDLVLRSRDLRKAPPVKAGDLVLISRTGAAGNVMRLATKTPWTHMAIVVDEAAPRLAAAQKTQGELSVRLELTDPKAFAADAEQYAIARISGCTDLCADAVSAALGEIHKKETISIGAEGFGILSGARLIGKFFKLSEKDLARAADGTEKPILPEDILAATGAKIIFSTRKN